MKANDVIRGSMLDNDYISRWGRAIISQSGLVPLV